MPQSAFKYEIEVGTDGKVEFCVPVPAGTKVEVVVLAPAEDTFADLVAAASAHLEFWDNPWDDEDWNHA